MPRHSYQSKLSNIPSALHNLDENDNADFYYANYLFMKQSPVYVRLEQKYKDLKKRCREQQQMIELLNRQYFETVEMYSRKKPADVPVNDPVIKQEPIPVSRSRAEPVIVVIDDDDVCETPIESASVAECHKTDTVKSPTNDFTIELEVSFKPASVNKTQEADVTTVDKKDVVEVEEEKEAEETEEVEVVEEEKEAEETEEVEVVEEDETEEVEVVEDEDETEEVEVVEEEETEEVKVVEEDETEEVKVVEEDETEEVEVVEEDETEEVEVVEEEEGEQVEEVTINNRKYYATSETNGVIYEMLEDGDVGDEVGKFVNGKAVFN